MKKLLTIALAATFLIACKGGEDSEGGGDSAKGTTFELKSTNAPLDKFEKKSSAAFKSGMSWNGTKYQPVMYLVISNQSELKFIDMYANFEMPQNEGDITIAFKFEGEAFDKGAEPTKLKEGDYPIGGETFNKELTCSSNVFTKGAVNNLSMKMSTSGTDFVGMAKITKLTADLVEGTIELKGADGTTLNCTFSEKIAKDYWETEFKGGKL